MDTSFNDTQDNIRPPDEVRSEQLLEDTRSDFEKEIDEAIYLSYQDIREKQELSRKYEEQILKEYNEETNRRKDIFRDLLQSLNKISRFDKEIREIYEIIDPIIDSYCSQYIKICELDEKTYNKIFGLLKKIRNNQLVFNLLKEIIIKK
jgi:hypothetical protein